MQAKGHPAPLAEQFACHQVYEVFQFGAVA